MQHSSALLPPCRLYMIFILSLHTFYNTHLVSHPNLHFEGFHTPHSLFNSISFFHPCRAGSHIPASLAHLALQLLQYRVGDVSQLIIALLRASQGPTYPPAWRIWLRTSRQWRASPCSQAWPLPPPLPRSHDTPPPPPPPQPLAPPPLLPQPRPHGRRNRSTPPPPRPQYLKTYLRMLQPPRRTRTPFWLPGRRRSAPKRRQRAKAARVAPRRRFPRPTRRNSAPPTTPSSSASMW